MPIQLTYNRPSGRQFVIEGDNFHECVQAMRKSVAARKTGSLQAITGVPAFLNKHIDKHFHYCTKFKNIFGATSWTSQEVAAKRLDEHLEQLPLLKLASNIVLTDQPIPPEIEDALEDIRFIDACRVLGFPLLSLAETMERQGKGSRDELMEIWSSRFFPCPACHDPDKKSLQHLHAALRACTHADGTDSIHNPHKDDHAWNSGACALFATVVDRVIEGGGHYIAVGYGGFDQHRTIACEHVALRVGNWIADGAGVHDVTDFMNRWECNRHHLQEFWSEPHEGVIGRMSTGRAQDMLDVNALEVDLRQCGVGPWMLTGKNTSEPEEITGLNPMP